MARHRTANRNETADSWSAFRTAIGWLGIAGRGEVVRAVFVGHPSVVSVMQTAQRWAIESSSTGSLVEADWYPALRERLQAYAKGEPVDFDDFELELPERTPFRDKV